jgi:2-methylcitrate dehydratase PrpD
MNSLKSGDARSVIEASNIVGPRFEKLEDAAVETVKNRFIDVLGGLFGGA